MTSQLPSGCVVPGGSALPKSVRSMVLAKGCEDTHLSRCKSVRGLGCDLMAACHCAAAVVLETPVGERQI